ncbi:TetR/AcrR family transcriptional regulator [Lactobacillus sp. Sy-1]|uniref:TetR/AcrR family transcriptional regulator n=1 Tax=Lactobacillus sp. Sy-1 TaxID=2109645 RepID=UPI001C59F0A7|nr:TetR/AcrR family transcriptional regulator [Lactobacillus sp. Sy-1]MBW1605040.1 TetR/AcrR family transcriptional regulator [Lactobacillus sp. Sy-1]
MAQYLNKITQTDNLIINSMINLAKQKGLNKVTISDIVAEAHINRSTFYRHFIDKDDLIEKSENMILNRIYDYHNQMVSTKLRYLKMTDQQQFSLKTFLTIIDDNHEIISFFLSNKSDSSFSYKLIDLFLKMTYESWDYLLPNRKKIDRKLFAYYSFGAIIATIKLWVDNYDDYSKEDIYNFILTIRNNEIQNL